MTCGASYNWLATATGRAGYTFGRALFYAKGGAAWADERFVASCNTSHAGPLLLPCAGPNGANLTTRVGISNGFTAGTTKTGWVLGFGTDFALGKNWFARGETNYIDFGDSRLTGSDGTVFSAGSHVWQTKIGLNYRFNSESAVVAKY
jgi:opacity protein-like surface antigen